MRTTPGIALHASRRRVLPALPGWIVMILPAICMSMLAAKPLPAIADDSKTNRMLVDYVPPTNPAQQPLYDLLKERRALEKLQEIFSPFRLPIDLTLRAVSCDGVANAWYRRPAVNVCYEYLAEIQKTIPKETTPAGVTPTDAILGQFFYVYAHEMGHAMFDILKVPVFGDAENAADHFAAYLMLQFGREQSRGLILGAAYSYKKYVQNPEITAPLAAFSDIHAAPAQRYFNLICLAYGADPKLFAEVVTDKHLPEARARNCKGEYDQVTFAFRDLIQPHVDEQLARKVLDRTWLPEAQERPVGN